MKQTPLKRKTPLKSKGRRGRANTPADVAFSKFVRSKGYCEGRGWHGKPETCRGQLECSHRIRRGVPNLRWDEQNADCLCSGCHEWFGRNKNAYWQFIEEKDGLTRADLMLKSKEPGLSAQEAVEKYREAA